MISALLKVEYGRGPSHLSSMTSLQEEVMMQAAEHARTA